MKTIFITVARGFIMRNILRSGVLELLKKKGLRIVIFIHSVNKNIDYIPDYLKKEFNSEQVKIIALRNPNFNNKIKNKLYRYFGLSIKGLVFTRYMWDLKMRISNVKMFAYINGSIYMFLSRFNLLKSLARWIEYNIFYHDCYIEYFDKYKPDIVFSCSIISRLDITFMKEAKKRGIKTVSMPKGWDNVSNKLYRILPDKLIVQNNEMKKDAIKYQRIKSDNISVCGFPQFDWYRRPEILLSREEFFKKIGLDPERRLIFFGSEGLWSKNDEENIKFLINAINVDKSLVKHCSLIIRSHFSDAITKRFDKYSNEKNVKVDDNFFFSDIFHDSCDPGTEEIIQFVNTIYHSDIIISIASTLSLDAACFYKPNINPAYNSVFHEKTGEDISNYRFFHRLFLDAKKTGGIEVVYSDKELFERINFHLKNPGAVKENIEELIKMLCYKVDGQSSRRIADVILSMLNNT